MKEKKLKEIDNIYQIEKYIDPSLDVFNNLQAIIIMKLTKNYI